MTEKYFVRGPGYEYQKRQLDNIIDNIYKLMDQELISIEKISPQAGTQFSPDQ